MSTNFPTSLDTLTNPTSSDTLNSPDHAAQHANANDAIEALQAKVGADSSAVTSSHDYKLSGVTGSDKAASKTGTETLTNKTLTSPKINVGSDATGDTLYRDSNGNLARLAIGSTDQILTVASGLPSWQTNPTIANTPTTGEKAALPGDNTDIAVGSGNKFVTQTGLQKQAEAYASSGGSANAYTVTLSPVPTSYAAGMIVRFLATFANTGSATLNVNSLGAKTIKKTDGATNLSSGDIANGQLVVVVYDGTNFQMVSPVATSTASYKTGTTTKALTDASTSQNIAHGLGVTPKFIRIIGVNYNSNIFSWSHGVYNGTTQSCLATFQDVTSGVIFNDATSIIRLYGAGSNTAYQTGVASIDSTNITISWTKNNSPTGTGQIMWEAFA